MLMIALNANMYNDSAANFVSYTLLIDPVLLIRVLRICDLFFVFFLLSHKTPTMSREVI